MAESHRSEFRKTRLDLVQVSNRTSVQHPHRTNYLENPRSCGIVDGGQPFSDTPPFAQSKAAAMEIAPLNQVSDPLLSPCLRSALTIEFRLPSCSLIGLRNRYSCAEAGLWSEAHPATRAVEKRYGFILNR